MLLADAGAAAAKVQHGRRGNGDLWRVACADLAFQEFEVGELNVFGVAHLAYHLHHGWCQLLASVWAFHGKRNADFNAAQLLQKIDMKVSAAEFAIGDALQANVFLEFDNFRDGLVLNTSQLFSREDAFCLLLTRLQQVLGTQKAANVVKACGKVSHLLILESRKISRVCLGTADETFLRLLPAG